MLCDHKETPFKHILTSISQLGAIVPQLVSLARNTIRYASCCRIACTKLGYKLYFSIMLLYSKIYPCAYNLFISIIILNNENVVVDTTLILLSYILSEILNKLGFTIMAVANLHIQNKYTC